MRKITQSEWTAWFVFLNALPERKRETLSFVLLLAERREMVELRMLTEHGFQVEIRGVYETKQ